MSDDITKELQKVLQKAAIDGTFSESAVDQFREIIAARDALVSANEAQAEEIETLTKAADLLRSERDKARTALEALDAIIDDVREREKEITRLEMKAANEAQRVADHQKMFELVFRNTTVRQGVLTPIPPPLPDQYGNMQYGQVEPGTVESTEG